MNWYLKFAIAITLLNFTNAATLTTTRLLQTANNTPLPYSTDTIEKDVNNIPNDASSDAYDELSDETMVQEGNMVKKQDTTKIVCVQTMIVTEKPATGELKKYLRNKNAKTLQLNNKITQTTVAQKLDVNVKANSNKTKEKIANSYKVKTLMTSILQTDGSLKSKSEKTHKNVKTPTTPKTLLKTALEKEALANKSEKAYMLIEISTQKAVLRAKPETTDVNMKNDKTLELSTNMEPKPLTEKPKNALNNFKKSAVLLIEENPAIKSRAFAKSSSEEVLRANSKETYVSLEISAVLETPKAETNESNEYGTGRDERMDVSRSSDEMLYSIEEGGMRTIL